MVPFNTIIDKNLLSKSHVTPQLDRQWDYQEVNLYIRKRQQDYVHSFIFIG